MTLRLISLACPSCGSAMRAQPYDIVYLCSHCSAGAFLGEHQLEVVKSCAILPRSGSRAELWRPAWMLDADVVVAERRLADGRTTPGSSTKRRFVIPAFALSLQDQTELGSALTNAKQSLSTVPHEPVLGGTLSRGDAETIARHLVVGKEVRRPDMLASVQVTLTVYGTYLAATPFARAGEQLVCSVTGRRVSEVG